MVFHSPVIREMIEGNQINHMGSFLESFNAWLTTVKNKLEDGVEKENKEQAIDLCRDLEFYVHLVNTFVNKEQGYFL